MKNRLACRLALACAVLGAFVALVPNASAVLVRGSGTAYGRQQVISITPAAGKTVPPSLLYRPKFRAQPHLANGNLDYNGGSVFHSQAPYVIFWDPSSGISSTTESLIDRYFTDLAHDSGGANNVYGTLRQYYDSHGFADYAQTFSAGTQAFVDTAAYPAKDTANCVNTGIPAGNPCLTDPQVQAELTKLIAAHGWPTDGTDSTSLPANAPEYYVVLPANVNECSGGGNCADNVYCAYHSVYSPDGSNGVIYSMIPLLGSVIDFGNGPGKGCQADGHPNIQKPNGDQQADIALKYTSHEQVESITDPVPPSGWVNNELPGSGGEIGDECNFFGPTVNPGAGSNPNAFTPTLGGTAAAGDLFNQLDNGNKYYIQSEWSNGDVASGGCVMRQSPGSISPTFAVTPTGGSAVSLNPGASTSTGGFSSVTWSFGDGATSFSHTAPAALSHSYAAAGTYTVKLTLVDTLGNVSSSSQQITVGQPPTGSFSSSPGNPVQGTAVSFSGSASDPNTGVTTAIGWNFGDGSTGAGAVTSHPYANAGTFTVTMAILDSAGHTAFVSHTVTVAKAAIGKKVAVKHKTKKGATLVVTVNAAGKVSADGKSKTANGAGSVSLKIKLTKAQRNKLASKGKLTLHIKVTFKPNVGSAVTQKVTIKFKA